MLPCSLPSRLDPPYSASLRRLRHATFEFVFVIFVLFYYHCVVYPLCLPSLLVSCVLLAPPSDDRNIGIVLFWFSLALCLPSSLLFPILVFRLVLFEWSSCWSMAWTYPVIDHSSKHNLDPSGLGLRPECMLILVLFCLLFI